jgi:hypothetical protein
MARTNYVVLWWLNNNFAFRLCARVPSGAHHIERRIFSSVHLTSLNDSGDFVGTSSFGAFVSFLLEGDANALLPPRSRTAI